MNKDTTRTESTNEITRRRINLRDGIGVTAILFIALLIGSTPQSTPGDPSTRDIAWAAVSYLGVLALLLASYLSYRRADERQQLVQLKASAIAFTAVILGLFTAEMLYALKEVDLNPVIQTLFIGGIVLWILLQKLIESRSR